MVRKVRTFPSSLFPRPVPAEARMVTIRLGLAEGLASVSSFRHLHRESVALVYGGS